MRAQDFAGDFTEFLRKYDYQPKLTAKLDCLDAIEISQSVVNELVLWKVNRFVEMSPDDLRGIESLKQLKAGEHRHADAVLASLLKTRGVDIAMASTFLEIRLTPQSRL